MMNTTDPASPCAAATEAPSPAAAPGRTLIWDLPLRAFHWMLAASFAGAWLTAESETWRNVHIVLGYGMVVLLGFRLVWGLVGTRYARFTALRLSPRALRDELAGLWARRPVHVAGHNAPGSWAIIGLLGLLATTVLSGALQFLEIGPDLGGLHEFAASAALALVAVHVAGVVVSSLLHRENLVRAMITGTKRVAGAPAADGPRAAVAVVLVAVVAGLWSGWIPSPGLPDGTPLASVWGGGTGGRSDGAQSSGRDADPRHAQGRHDDD